MKTEFVRVLLGSVLSLASSNVLAAMGGLNGGGGYSVRCQDDRFYAMDFLATERDATELEPRITTAVNSEDILRLILERMQIVRPELAVSFGDFIARNDKESNTNSTRLWINGLHPLLKLTDQQSIRNIKNCVGQSTEAEVFQAVIRQEFPGGIVYNRDADQLAHLEATGPMQSSFTYVHEWLRDFTEDANIIMHVSYFLHSKDFFKLSASEVEMVFQRHGLNNLPGHDMIKNSIVPSLSLIRISWSENYAYSTVNFDRSVYICAQKIYLHSYYGKEAPDFSKCSLVKSLPPQPISYHGDGWGIPYFSDREIPSLDESVMVPGALINAFAKDLDRAYLVVVSKVRGDSNAIYSTNNFDISKVAASPSKESYGIKVCIGGPMNKDCTSYVTGKLNVTFVPLRR